MSLFAYQCASITASFPTHSTYCYEVDLNRFRFKQTVLLHTRFENYGCTRNIKYSSFINKKEYSSVLSGNENGSKKGYTTINSQYFYL